MQDSDEIYEGGLKDFLATAVLRYY